MWVIQWVYSVSWRTCVAAYSFADGAAAALGGVLYVFVVVLNFACNLVKGPVRLWGLFWSWIIFFVCFWNEYGQCQGW